MLEDAARRRTRVELSEPVRARVRASRDVLERFVQEEWVTYGDNTSMGGFVDHLVPVAQARRLQENLIDAVATNVGAYLDDTTVRALMLSRVVSLSRGNSAITPADLERLVEVYNAGIVPCVPEKGSLGTSGDLGGADGDRPTGSAGWPSQKRQSVAVPPSGSRPVRAEYRVCAAP